MELFCRRLCLALGTRNCDRTNFVCEKMEAMGGGIKAAQQSEGANGFVGVVWRHKGWWLPAVVVLLVLVGIVYLIGHLSSADSEMYPTSSFQTSTYLRLC